MTSINTLTGIGSGLAAAGERVERAAKDVQRAFNEDRTRAENARAADSIRISQDSVAAPAVEEAMRSAVLPERDVTQAVVDLLKASTAYTAQTRAAQVTGDVVQDAISVIGKREV